MFSLKEKSESNVYLLQRESVIIFLSYMLNATGWSDSEILEHAKIISSKCFFL